MGISDLQSLKRSVVEASGSGVRIGLLDTGVDSRHPQLAGTTIAHYEAVMGHIGPVVNRVRHGMDSHDHGTACAGVLHRLAPGAELHSLQVVADGPRDRPEKLIAGLRFAVASGWEIINVSVGVTRPNADLLDLVRQASRKGIIVVAAKDNRPGVVGYPAAWPEVIAVDMDYFPDPLTWRYRGGPGVEVDVEANGVYVQAPVAGTGRQASFTGSSFAAPHVAALAARLKQVKSDCTVKEFRNFLQLGQPQLDSHPVSGGLNSPQ